MIDFVILHYQALDETVNCVNTIFEKVSGDKRVVIVDNLSPNGSGKTLEEKYKNDPNVSVILTGENLGFAKGNNIGYLEAKKDNPDFIVVMNNDVFIQQGDFTDLVNQSYSSHRFDVLGPDIYSTKVKGHQNPQRAKNYTLEELEKSRKKLEFKNNFKFLLRLKYMLPQKKEEDWSNRAYIKESKTGTILHGACYIFSKDFIRKHDNCFYNGTFMYYESYILHYLGMREGLEFVYDPSIKVLHHEDVSTNQTYGKMYSKAIFVNKCQLDSCKVFIDVIKNNAILP